MLTDWGWLGYSAFVFRRLLAALSYALVMLVTGCHHGPSGDPVVERAKGYFGPDRSVSPFGIPVPHGRIFVAVPNPIPNDYEGYEAILVPENGEPLRGDAALRAVWNSGVRDPETLARVAALFVGNSRQVAHAADVRTTIIRGHENLADPVLTGWHLVFFAVRGQMAPEAYEVTVDLTTFKASERLASAIGPVPPYQR